MKKGEKMNPIPKEERDKLWCVDHQEFLPRTEFVPSGKTSAGRQKYTSRCRPCWYKFREKNHPSVKRALDIKEYVLSIKTECKVCGYNKCKAALDFHHIDPNEKDDRILNLINRKKSLEVIQKEIDKCVVLCCRCHREVHAGILEL